MIFEMKKDKSYKKMTPEEVQGLLQMRKRGRRIPAKKGKGSYNRNDFKKGVAQNENFPDEE